MQPETKFKMKVQARLKIVPRCWFFKTQQIMLLGIPDIIGVIDGRFFAWELKKDAKSKPTKLQITILDMIKKAGGIAEVVSPENLEEHLARLSKEA